MLSDRGWRAAHSRFFAAYWGIADETPLVCQRFRVLHFIEDPLAGAKP